MLSRVASLTKRQRECLRGKWDRKLDKVIATELGISQRAVEEHLRAARERLGVGSSVEASQMAASELGWRDTVAPQGGPTELPKVEPAPPQSPSDDEGAVPEALAVNDAGWATDRRRHHALGRPLRKRGERFNDLSSTGRMSWIIIISTGIPAAMVLLFASTDYIGRFVADISRLTN